MMPDLQRLYQPMAWVIESNIGRVLDQNSAFGQFETAYCKAGRTPSPGRGRGVTKAKVEPVSRR